MLKFRDPKGGFLIDRRHFILITIIRSKKLTCFKQKYQKSKNIAEYPAHQLICLGRLEIHITFLFLRVYSYFELDKEQDLMGKPLLIKQENILNDFCSFLINPTILE